MKKIETKKYIVKIEHDIIHWDIEKPEGIKYIGKEYGLSQFFEQEVESVDTYIDNLIEELIEVGGQKNLKDYDNLDWIDCQNAFEDKFDFDDSNQEINLKNLDLAMELKIIKGYHAIYMFEHGNVAYSLSPFGCRFDSGCIGYLIVENDAKDYEWALSKEHFQEITDIRNDEIYYCTIETKRTCPTSGEVKTEVQEICGGFVGSDFEKNGLLDFIKENLTTDEFLEVKESL